MYCPLSKTQIREKYRCILKKYSFGDIVNPVDYAFLFSIIEKSQKRNNLIGAGISHIIKISHPIYKKDCFAIKRVDGSDEIIGFDRLIYPRDAEEVYIAFRFAILQQIYVYRLTHDADHDEDVHHVIPFRRLVNRFLESRGLLLTDISVKKHQIKPDVWEIESNEIVTAWRAYHKNECDLQLITKEEHRSFRGDD